MIRVKVFKIRQLFLPWVVDIIENNELDLGQRTYFGTHYSALKYAIKVTQRETTTYSTKHSKP